MKKINQSLLIAVLGMFLVSPAFSQSGLKNKFGARLEAGYGMKLKSDYSNTYQLFFSPHYRISQDLVAGVGTGVMWQGDIEPRYNIPLYAHATYTVNTHSDFTMFFNLKVGYGIGSGNSSFQVVNMEDNTSYVVQTEHNNGIFVSPSVGVNYKLNENRSIFFAVSYDLLKIKNTSKVNSNGNPVANVPKYADKNSTIGLRIGYEF